MSKITFLILFSLCFILSCKNEESSSGDIFFEKGKYRKAIQAYSDYLATNPDHEKTLYNRGRSYEELGRFDNAVADFKRIVELDPYNINAFLSLAKVSYNTNNYNQVLLYAGKAIKLNENSAQAHFLHARGAHQLGYTDQALEAYNNAITIDKDFGEAYLYRGALKIGLEKKRPACEDFNFARLLNVEGADKALATYCE